MNQIINRLLKDFDVHLASSSPRRKRLLEQIGLTFTVTPSTFEENLDKSTFAHPKDYVLQTALCKGEEVMKKLRNQDVNKPRFVISTDTVIVAEDKILEKPPTHEIALEMLTRLNKVKSHVVYSGVTLIKYDGNQETLHQFYECSTVVFGDIPEQALKDYANTIEPLDKAGGYGIQEVGATLIEKVDGCSFNVMGFPIYRFCQELYKWMG